MLLSVAAACLLASDVVAAEEIALFNGFKPGWRESWREQSLFSRRNVFELVTDDGLPVLHVISQASNSCLVRPTETVAPTSAVLNWRWKVRAALTGNAAERERRGDDYAARVVVVFEKSALPLRTRAINYVWAAREPVGAIFASPYSSNVAMIVLQSGAEGTGQWQVETRDVLADYRRFFRQSAGRISGVGVLTDTDNTNAAAEAWFADLSLKTVAAGSVRE